MPLWLAIYQDNIGADSGIESRDEWEGEIRHTKKDGSRIIVDSIRHHSVQGQVLVTTPSYAVLRPREPAAVSAHLLMSACTLGFCV